MGLSFPLFRCGLLIFLLAAGWAQQPPVKKDASVTKSAPAAKSAPTAAPRTKAIWEPLSLKADLKLLSVRFVSADEGWIAGGKDELNGGVIMHTKDGGATWETQLGDPKSNEHAYRDLHFLGPTLGWATQEGTNSQDKLYQTKDGRKWELAGSLPQHHTAYLFTSEKIGYVLYGRDILQTNDGGHNWRSIYRCQAKYDVKGTPRSTSCEFETIFFVTVNLGYALSRPIDRGAPNVLAKTTDGGATWETTLILPGESMRESSLWFTTETHGVARSLEGKIFYTDDGGKKWTAAIGLADGRPEIEFAGANVGWMIKDRAMTYTTDGGKRWLSRTAGFPNWVTATSLVSRERGYAVGERGMIYRYRVVPITYTAAGILLAPGL